MTPWKRIVAGALALTLVAAACGDDDSADAGPDTGTLVTTGLAQLPRSVVDGGTAELRVGDLVAASEAAGIDVPDRDDHEATRRWLSDLTGGPDRDGSDTVVPVHVTPPALFSPSWFAELDAVDAELGWTPADVSWFAEYSVPPNVVTVLGGDFPAERLDAALGTMTDGVWAIGPHDGEIDLPNATAARPLGESLRIGGGNDRLVVARSTGAVRSVPEEGSDVETAADHPLLAPLGSALDREGAVSAWLLVGAEFAAPPDLTDALDDRLDELVLPQPFLALATASATDEQGPVGVIAYAHADAASAEANADAVARIVRDGSSLATGQPWSDLFTSVDVEVIDDDAAPVVVARVRLADGVRPTALYQAILRRDGIASHR